MKKDRKRKKAKTASAVSVPVEATVSVSPSLQEGMQALQLLVDDLGGKMAHSCTVGVARRCFRTV